jgi:hypothetical protein
VEVRAKNDTKNTAISGAFALSLNSSGSTSVGLAGAVTVNLLTNVTQARIDDSSLNNVGDVTVDADAAWTTTAVAAGIGASANGYGVAGSVAINTIDTDTWAKVNRGVIDAASLSITAKDTTSIVAVAGSIAFGGKAGIGAGFAYNRIGGGAEALLNGTDVSVSGAVNVTATNSSQITSVAAAIAVAVSKTSASLNAPPDSKASSSFSLAAAAGIVINSITTDTLATIQNTGTATDPLSAGSVTVSATDKQSKIVGVGGGIAVSASLLKSRNAQGNSTSLAAGASFVFNEIDQDVESLVDNVVWTVSGDVAVKFIP